MMFHILNGDALLENFKVLFPLGSPDKILGQYIICRECLMEGTLAGSSPDEFFKNRSEFISEFFIEEFESETAKDYRNFVQSEFEKIMNIPGGSEVVLWFEHDLFCQANMWFIISLLNRPEDDLRVYRSFPVYEHPEEIWKGFGRVSKADSLQALNNRKKLTTDDIVLGTRLWNAFRNNDLKELSELSSVQSEAFPFLKEVIKAHIERFDKSPGRPERAIRDIINSGKKEFREVFPEFSKREGVYGFGDVQVKKIYDKIINDAGVQLK